MIFVRLMNEGTRGTMIRNFIMEALWNDVEFRSKKLATVSLYNKLIFYSYKNIHIFMTHIILHFKHTDLLIISLNCSRKKDLS